MAQGLEHLLLKPADLSRITKVMRELDGVPHICTVVSQESHRPVGAEMEYYHQEPRASKPGACCTRERSCFNTLEGEQASQSFPELS